MAHIQSAATTEAAGGTAGITPASDVTAGDTMVVVVACDGGSATIGTPGDTQGNSFAPCHAVLHNGAGYSSQMFFAVAGSTGPNTITCTVSGATIKSFLYDEFDGGFNTIDVALAVNDSSSPGFVTTAPNDLIVSYMFSSGPATPGAAYTAGASQAVYAYEKNEYDLDAGTAGNVTVDWILDGALMLLAAAFYVAATATHGRGTGSR